MIKEKEIIITLLQNSLTGELDPSSNFNPQFLADAIIEKIEFDKTLKERNAKKIDEVIESFNEMIDDIDEDMDTELLKLGTDSSDVFIKNFIRGQKTACEKLKDKLKYI